ERLGHIELAAALTHIWYVKRVPSRLGYLLDLAPKDLEQAIYFAAYLITSADEDSRHRDLPSLQTKIAAEKPQIGARRDAHTDRRAKKLEDDLAALDADGGTAQAKKKLRDTAEKEMDKLRRNADREIDRIEQVWDRFKNLKVNDLE